MGESGVLSEVVDGRSSKTNFARDRGDQMASPCSVYRRVVAAPVHRA